MVALAVSLLTAGSSTVNSPYTTASVTMTAGELVVVNATTGYGSNAPPPNIVVPAGLTLVESRASIVDALRMIRTSVYKVDTTVSGTIGIEASTSTAATSGIWTVYKITGQSDTPVKQSNYQNANAVTSFTLSLSAALSSSRNMMIGGICNQLAQLSTSTGTNDVVINEATITARDQAHIAAYDAGGAEISATWGSSANVWGTSFEIEAAPDIVTGTADVAGSGTLTAQVDYNAPFMGGEGTLSGTVDRVTTEWSATASATTDAPAGPSAAVDVSGSGTLTTAATSGQTGTAAPSSEGTVSAAGKLILPVPTNLRATSITAAQIDLVWDAVSGAGTYDVRRDGTVIATGISTASYSDTNTGGVGHIYQVRAVQ